MEAVGDEAEVFPEGPWMQDWTTFPLSFSNPLSDNPLPMMGVNNDPFGKTRALGFGEDFFICKDE
jgi:hypothetical protein